MAAANIGELEYKILTKVSIGGRFLTITEVKVVAEEEEYVAKGIKIKPGPEGLGMPDSLVDFAMCNLFVNEKSEKVYDAQLIGSNFEKLVLYQAGKEKEFNPEAEAKTKLKGYYAIIMAVGR